MKVIFLDFDGVLNTFEHLQKVADRSEWHVMIDPEKVKLLNEIVEATGAKVVFSTSWRKLHASNKLFKFLKLNGFKGNHLGMTPDFNDNSHRGLEVAKWIRDCEVDIQSFVVLDDTKQFSKMPQRHVLTDMFTGLLPEHVEQAIKILNTPFDNSKEFL